MASCGCRAVRAEATRVDGDVEVGRRCGDGEEWDEAGEGVGGGRAARLAGRVKGGAAAVGSPVVSGGVDAAG
eukprot:scaffold9202_cov94-Isochrysis_galbana.AAC.2